VNSIRRFYLDNFLDSNFLYLTNDIIDIGGVGKNRRGSSNYPRECLGRIKYLNINSYTKPDYNCSIEDILSFNDKFDCIIATELLEYIDNIDNCFYNFNKLAKIDSILLLSWPWMNALHGDYDYDLKRYSFIYIRNKLGKYGYKIIEANANGGFFTVIWDFIHRIHSQRLIKFLPFRIFIKIFLILSKKLFILLDKWFYSSDFVSTGYTLVAKKIKNL
tara:strand:- start:16 stop:669 length:654 start_codon:yes stop_codon:yes gene_type:complete